jgi:hypothetical protein
LIDWACRHEGTMPFSPIPPTTPVCTGVDCCLGPNKPRHKTPPPPFLHTPPKKQNKQCQKATEIPSVLLTPHPDIARLLASLSPSLDLERVDLEEALGKEGAARLRDDDAWLNALQAQVGGWMDGCVCVDGCVRCVFCGGRVLCVEEICECVWGDRVCVCGGVDTLDRGW